MAALTELLYDNPLRSVLYEDPQAVYNTATSSWDALTWYYKDYGSRGNIVAVDLYGYPTTPVLIHDLGTNPQRLNGHLQPWKTHSNGKAYMSVLGVSGQTFLFTFDPSTMTLTIPATPVVAGLAGETHGIEIGTDGKLCMWGGDYHASGKVSVALVDPTTLVATGYISIGSAQGTQECAGAAWDGRYIYYCSARTNSYTIGCYDTVAQTDTTLVTGASASAGGYGSVTQLSAGAKCSVILPGQTTRTAYWLYNGAAVPMTGDYATVPPWAGGNAGSPADLPWFGSPIAPTFDKTLMTPDATGTANLGYKLHGAGSFSYASFNVATYPYSISRATRLTDGRIMVCSAGYGGQQFYDPADHSFVWPGVTRNLSEYCEAVSGSKVYLGGYGNGQLALYDANSTYNCDTIVDGSRVVYTDAGANPKLIATVKVSSVLNLSPWQADAIMDAVVDGAGMVWTCGQDRRAGYGGVVAVYDPSGPTWFGILTNYFNANQTDFLAVTTGGRYIAVSCHRVNDPSGTMAKPDSGQVFIFDRTLLRADTTADLVAAIKGPFAPYAHSKGAGKIVGVSTSEIVGWQAVPVYNSSTQVWSDSTTQSSLYRLHMTSGSVVQSVTLNYPSPWNLSSQGEPNDLTMGPDGNLYLFLGTNLVQIDPQDLTQQTTIGQCAPAQMAWDPNTGDLYLTNPTGSGVDGSGNTIYPLRRIQAVADVTPDPTPPPAFPARLSTSQYAIRT